MPANPKHLTKSGWTRFSKITAGILGGLSVTLALHFVLMIWFDRATVIITMTFSGYILWAALLLLAFLVKHAWKIWAIYLLIVGACVGVLYFGNGF